MDNQQNNQFDRTEQLERLFALKQKGAITDEEYESEKKKMLGWQAQNPVLENTATETIDLSKTAPKKKKSGCLGVLFKAIGLFVLLIVVISFFAPSHKEETTSISNSDTNITTTVNLNTGSSTNKAFVPSYVVLANDDLTLGGVPRFEQRISVPLKLSTEELKQTLLDAAWKLQKQKNASAVVIFAYREDDKKRNGGYSAAKCTLAPFGNWAKAMERHKTSDLQAVFEISEAYSYDEPLREKGSSAFIKENDAELYKPDTQEFYAEDVAMKLKKGTEVKILDSQRDISSFAVIDIYKVQVRLDKKRTRTGWVYGHKLTDEH